ncbi:MAG: BrnT family toxin [Candidatus Contendobacter sp.]|nr:BrnT family toxin [Candidatus Contendobacter sp.]
MEFEWDKRKAASNLKKHGVSFGEAASVFGDPLALTFDDPDHSIGERRLLTFGATRTGKLVIVSHTERERSMRIISVRIMQKHEREIYEKG